MSSAPRLPALFVGHGSPMNALEDNAFTQGWRAIAAALPRPRAVLCISAHWETNGVTALGASAQPDTIHDFYGFPQPLFDLRYAAPGDPALAARTAERLGGHARLDAQRGLDHGVWSVLSVMYPAADIPVVPLSLDRAMAPDAHYRLAQRLQPLRDDGVLILGSGNTVHNLREFDWRDPRPLDWAVRANRRVNDAVARGDHAMLSDWNALDADVRRGIAGPEHWLPLLYALAQQQPGETVRTFNDSVIGSIAMTSFVVG